MVVNTQNHNPDIIYMYIVLSKVKNASLSHYKHCVSGMSYCCLTSNERLLSYIITNQSLFVLMLNSMVFGLSSPLIEPTTFSTWVEHTNIYVHNRAITAFMVTCVVARCFQYRKYSAFKVFFRPGKYNCMIILLIQTVSCYVHTLTVWKMSMYLYTKSKLQFRRILWKK